MLLSWLVFPVVMLAVAAGCGLAVARAAGDRLARPLILPTGFAAMVVVASSATADGRTADLATPLVLALAVTGWLVASDRKAWIPDRWACAAGLGVFAVFGAPSVLSGGATFTGYIQLDDIATWLAITDQMMSHSRDLSSLQPSTYFATVNNYLPSGYPAGAFLPLGVGGELMLGRDIAWLFAPTMALTSGLLALTITGMLAPLLSKPWARAVVAFVAAQAALLVAYAEWGAIKEVTTAMLIALVAALAPTLGAPRPEPEDGVEIEPRTDALGRLLEVRTVLPLGVAIAATIAAVSVGGGVWVVPIVLVALVASRPEPRALLYSVPVLTVSVALLSVPSLLVAKKFITPLNQANSVLTAPTELGNLRGPLDKKHVLGIWPAGDFRDTPDQNSLMTVLLILLVIAAIAGLGVAIWRKAGSVAGYLAGGLFACLLLVSRGSPWVDAKAMATASPMVLTAALAGLAWLGTEQLKGAARRMTWAGLAVLGAGVLWSNVLTYGASYVAPREQLAELSDAGEMLRGQGPTLMTEYEPYGARHFLRKADGESASELRVRPIPLRDGSQLGKSAYADVGRFDPGSLREYRSLVLRTSPLASRPPTVYQRVKAGTSYDVWQRPADATGLALADLPLGDDATPGAQAPCASVRDLARQAGAGGSLVTVDRIPPTKLDLSTAQLSGGIQPYADARFVVPQDDGSLQGDVTTDKARKYDVWVGGSTRGKTTVRIDGKVTGSVRGRLNNSGGMMHFGEIELPAGTHTVDITYTDGGLAPGQRGQASQPLVLGPFVLGPQEPQPLRTRTVPVAQATTLCGRYLDWIEAYPAG